MGVLWQGVSQLIADRAPVVASVVTRHPLLQQISRQITTAIEDSNRSLREFDPVELLFLAIIATLIFVWLRCMVLQVLEDGVARTVFGFLRSLPVVKGKVSKEKAKMRADLMAARKPSGTPPVTELPSSSLTAAAVRERMGAKAAADMLSVDGKSLLSGTVYMGSSEHKKLLDEVFSLFSTSNPLHSDVFPSVRQMEAEVVAMTAGMLGGGDGGANPDVCGTMTSGGTESILLAMLASRNWARQRHGIRKPEIIMARSAHAAYIKAAEYFNMKPVVVDVGPDMRMSASSVRRVLTRNTAVVVASAPCFPHGVVDHVADIAKICRKHQVCLHVDACLGGFVLPFAHKLGYPVPPFDFSVPGVTSMSVDTHKFGLAHKGSSVVLFSSPDLRACQFTSITDWSGGLYISPTMAGSRPGALIACTYAAMLHVGEEGYLKVTRGLMECAHQLSEGINRIPELRVVGQPDMCLVAFGPSPAVAKKLNIYKLKDLLSKKGWHLNALQTPPALHFCFTAAHLGSGAYAVVAQLLGDIQEGVHTLMANPDVVKGGTAPMYAAANIMPDRGMLGEFLVEYQNVMCSV